jgi:hypothetical protein
VHDFTFADEFTMEDKDSVQHRYAARLRSQPQLRQEDNWPRRPAVASDSEQESDGGEAP